MSFLYLLERARIACPPLGYLFAAITYLGDEVAFLAVALIVMWCVSKREGYYLLSVGFLGTVINQFMKIVYRVPRPWVSDPGFSAWEQAKERAAGYSFPSGHTQNAAGTYGALAVWHGDKAKGRRRAAIYGIAGAAVLLVAFSRMLLGVHTPADVLTSLGIAMLLVILLRPLFREEVSPKKMLLYTAMMVALALAYLLFVELFHHPAGIDPDNLAEARKNGYTLFGAALGVLVMMVLEARGISYDTRATALGQVVKVGLGLGIVVGLKAALKPLLVLIFSGHPAESLVRYFILVLVAGVLYPRLFPYFAKLGYEEPAPPRHVHPKKRRK